MNPLFKVFSIIETVVAHQSKGITYSELVAELGLPKASVHRILKELTELGYLNYNLETKRYSGSLHLAALGAEVISNFQLRDHVRPFLMDLNRATQHTTNLAIKDGTMGVFMDKIESQDFGIKLFSEIGKTFPLHCTALGKSLLAFSDDKSVDEMLKAPLDPVTDHTITDPKVFRRELALIREQGYALDNEEITRGIVCVAAPVFGLGQELSCAISITFPAYLRDDRGIDPEIKAIKEYSAKISASLGHR